MKAARARPGETSLRNSIHLPSIDASMLMNPVRFPPGCGRLATKPLPTGAETMTNTIGMILVVDASAAVAGVACPSSTSGCVSTSSFASVRRRSGLSAAKR
jgi:hypothetical protein